MDVRPGTHCTEVWKSWSLHKTQKHFKWLSKESQNIAWAVAAEILSNAGSNPSEVIQCRIVYFSLNWSSFYMIYIYKLMAQQPPCRRDSLHLRGFMITLRHTTLGRTPLEKLSAQRRDVYLTKHNTHNRQTSMIPAGFEHAVPVGFRRKGFLEIFNYFRRSSMEKKLKEIVV
jgi:hypothetical protein